MKIKELSNNLLKKKYFGYSAEVRMLESYMKENDDIVIAYVKNCLGVIFILKTKKGFMCFINTFRYFRGYNLFRISMKECLRLINNNELKIVNDDLWNKFQTNIALMELENKNNDYNY
jgi:hypothetical protein